MVGSGFDTCKMYMLEMPCYWFDNLPRPAKAEFDPLNDAAGSANIAQVHTGDLSQADLTHRRFGHASAGYVCTLNGTKSCKLSFCDACTQAKMHRRPFSSKHVEKKEDEKVQPLDIAIVADLCGPMRTPSLGGARYFALITDLASRFMWVFLLKSKDLFVGAFKVWLALMLNTVGRYPKRVHTDGGGEFCNNQMEQTLNAAGIQHTATAPGSSQQNPVASATCTEQSKKLQGR